MENESITIAAALCRPFEGLFLKPYLCPTGVPTIGYGTTQYPNGLKVSLADPPITKERAEELMRWELSVECLPAVERLCPGQSTNVQAALIDFVYNLGAGRLQSSTLRKRINAGDIPGAKTELCKWAYGGGKKLPGLIKRRAAEAALLQV